MQKPRFQPEAVQLVGLAQTAWAKDGSHHGEALMKSREAFWRACWVAMWRMALWKARR